MASISVFTIAAKNYLAYVRVLLDSIRRLHPEYKLFLCLADRVDGRFEPKDEGYSIVTAEDLRIPNFVDFSLRYDIMEFSTAVKPFMFRWLFENTESDAVIYLDPDIRLYSRLDRLEELLVPGTSVVLTPHITQPLDDGKVPSDSHMLQAGVFNLGFVAATRCEESFGFMDWWSSRLSTQCVADMQNGLFVDQKWCDLAPCLLDDLRILKEDGYNVAYWNLAHRQMNRDAQGEWRVNGKPLAFFHFSGVNPGERRTVSKHQNRYSWSDVPAIQPLFDGYIDELHAAGWNDARAWPYAFGVLLEGAEIHRLMRIAYRETHPEPMAIDRDAQSELLIRACNEPADPSWDDGSVTITKLMSLVYRQRPDIQTRFALQSSRGRRQFASWFELAGAREYRLPGRLTQQSQIRRQLRERSSQRGPRASPGSRVLSVAGRLLRAASMRLPVKLQYILRQWWLAARSKVRRDV